MDTLDDSENNAKVSDSAYSNSCSNSQSRRSHSSKSTHSGSNSSGSSGYGGQPSTSGSSNQPPEKRTKEKDAKKEKQVQVETEKAKVTTDCQPPDPLQAPELEKPKEEHNVDQTPSPAVSHIDKGPESMDIASSETLESKEEVVSCNHPTVNTSVNLVTSRPATVYSSDGFSCLISMHDGVVMYTTSSLTAILGFPKDMWIGRSFIDFIHSKDRNTFASQITSGLAIPKIVNGTQEKVQAPANPVSTMVCRIRRYRGLSSGFGVKERVVTFMPFLLKLTLKNVNDEEGELVYLVIQATPFFSAFKVPNEILIKPIPFVMRHAANGNLEYLDPESVPYLGYLPQDVIGQDALKLYHPDDLGYLKQVYETIVKEGGLPRSKPYRMMSQNGEYIKLETEWSAFVNPWSKKLEFVIGKHFILEGPTNPDVFQSPDADKAPKVSDEEKNKHQSLRDSIIKIMNEVLTKPAEVAKQQMSKRCQDLASFMESLMEEQPKQDDELRLEIQDADHSYYGKRKPSTKAGITFPKKCRNMNPVDGSRIYNERDSMLGGISPHHDYNDSKSSTETPLSYNQLNYNENLQRYFNSHQPFSYEDYHTVTGENILGIKDAKPIITCLSPMAQHSGDSGEMTSSCESALVVRRGSPVTSTGEYQRVRLTETLLNKHNLEMEKELVRVHRGTRSSSKGEREKTSNEKRLKKKEHLARCNASFQPAALGTHSAITDKKPHGVKRASKHLDSETGANKHHCSSPRQTRRRHVTSAVPAQPSTTVTTTVANTNWQNNPVSNMNTFIMGVGFPQQMQLMSPVMSQQVSAMPGMFPVYYTPAQATSMPPPSSDANNTDPATSNSQFQAPAMQCMMYGQAMYSSPFMYSAMAPQVSYPMQQGAQGMIPQTAQYTNTLNPLCLTNSNYKEACKTSSVPLKLKPGGGWRDLKRDQAQAASKTNDGNADSSSSANDVKRITNPTTTAVDRKLAGKNTSIQNSDETIDRTDGESSYSSFFKTESNSAEDSGDPKKGAKLRQPTANFWDKTSPDDQSSIEATKAYRDPNHNKKATRRKMEPPWMEQVCVTSELVYKYQILTKSLEEVLTSDKQKMNNLAQPSMVNEQLGQLYLDLQLEGVAARLTLEEGITSSSSSGEETITNITTLSKRKREYSKLVMIYEEDAPLPPPSTDDDATPQTSGT